MVRLSIAVSFQDESQWRLNADSTVVMTVDLDLIKYMMETFPVLVEGLTRSAMSKFKGVMAADNELQRRVDTEEKENA